jgi:hypothetical protein
MNDLRYNVAKTEPAAIDIMLHTLTRRICKDQENAKPEETFQKILTITNKIVKEFSPVASPADGEHTAGSSSAPMTKVEQRKQSIKELKDSHHQLFVVRYI